MAEIMATAREDLTAAGAAIAGGHSSLGDELTIGFTITGLTHRPITLGGANVGDVLILTKPIGSGTIMAAEMVGQARGVDVVACIEIMLQEQGKAAEILDQAHAMTDVTGFGLLGHLRGMCDASGVGAVIAQGQVPLMHGAAELRRNGVRSTLFNDNVLGAGAISGTADALLYDPQTAGGLLAAVAADSADNKLAQLIQAGYQAAIIGEIAKGNQIKVT